MDPAWKELREDFPATQSFVYLNAAAASPTPRPVAQAVTGFYRDLEQGGDRFWDDFHIECPVTVTPVGKFLRVSCGWFNSPADLDALAAAVSQIAR